MSLKDKLQAIAKVRREDRARAEAAAEARLAEANAKKLSRIVVQKKRITDCILDAARKGEDEWVEELTFSPLPHGSKARPDEMEDRIEAVKSLRREEHGVTFDESFYYEDNEDPDSSKRSQWHYRLRVKTS